MLEIFEWMMEGRGGDGSPIRPDTETFNTLIASCHERGMLEKACEVGGMLRQTQMHRCNRLP